MKKIEQFTRNPLGIMALFVILVEGIAGLVISVNFSNLYGTWERLPLIWFIILFPCVVFVVFVWLVVKHNLKLYGPQDFDNQESYLKAMGKVIKPHKEPEPLKKPKKIRVKRNTKSICLFAYSKTNILDYPLLEVQDAALKKYSDENEMEIKTEVQISKGLVCDGVAEKNGELYLFEVVANYRSSDPYRITKALIHMSYMVEKLGNLNVQCVLILVSEDSISSETRDEIYSQVDNILLNVKIINFKTNEIIKKDVGRIN